MPDAQFALAMESAGGYFPRMIRGVAWKTIAARVGQGGRLLLFCLFFHAAFLRADDVSLTSLLAQGDLREQQHDTPAALDIFLKAEQLAPANAEVLCRLAKQYCDMMHLAKSNKEKQEFAAKSLAWAQLAAAADPQNPKAHVCAAVCYAKNFPFLDNKTKVRYSRRIKEEADKAIALDPKLICPITCSAVGIAKWPT